ncbi:Flagellar C1a complex subunit C1a-32 [Cinara cedri]|uniref:Flagellar C1a complex subunit C1a-32 n=1 Tax=Cinara cedri TaxID=506608 RepID=A0A5E4MJM0_9HEMI|nr:Flagellar C1a complex subunit C1a-32 [Cinara cedri]
MNSKKTIRADGISLLENINEFSERLFQEYSKQLSRYNIERQWPSIIKANNEQNITTANELSFWKYPARRISRAVSEPCLQTVRVLETTILQKNDSFHELREINSVDKRTPAESFKPKIMTWLYVTRVQCSGINYTKTDDDLLEMFDAMFQWELPNEKKIMSRLFADVAKYCKKHDLTDEKMSTLLGIYHYTHFYNKSLNVLGFHEVYNFFKELIIRHAVLSPPDHVKLFSVEEAKHMLTHFLNKYIICLPLIRHICVQKSRLRFQ